MRVSDFDFELPEGRIAVRPARPRDAARLLTVRPDGAFQDAHVSNLPELLSPGDILVFNDTRVISARLLGVRERDGSSVRVAATLLKRLSASSWTALMKPGKRLRPGDQLRFSKADDAEVPALSAKVASKHEDGAITLEFELGGAALDQAIEEVGLTPLPPYIAALRPEDEQDKTDYQTVYAREDGSVAAPTAGLHFTPELLETLKHRGLRTVFVTLHVGAGTFLPVKTEALEDHKMHAEVGEVSPEAAKALNAARAEGGRIVCIGTTALRLIESAADLDGQIQPFSGETSIFITPGYRFRGADVLFTNFHLPRSTLLMLVSAFAGVERARAAYRHALEQAYRFYSYGDASLWFREPAA